MKRKHCTLDYTEADESRVNRKRYTRAPPSQEPLPCKFKMLRQWQLTKEGQRYLEVKNQIEQYSFNDRTVSQWAIVPYNPNQYTLIDESLASSLFIGQAMDVEGVQVYGS